jgi:hypothetical protein
VTLSGEDSFGKDEHAADQRVVRGGQADFHVRLKTRGPILYNCYQFVFKRQRRLFVTPTILWCLPTNIFHCKIYSLIYLEQRGRHQK